MRTNLLSVLHVGSSAILTANRKYFYGASCTYCTDSRVTVLRNNFMMQ